MKKPTLSLVKIISALMCATMLFTLTPTVFADGVSIEESAINATTDSAFEDANKLYKLGLFKGVGIDSDGNPEFDLERTATRNEAVTMLVRLLGKDEAANRGEWTTPFTDVDEWVKPYVGYAYNYALTGGTSADTFSGSSNITAAQYITFVLRALDYVSGIHFTWSAPWELSDAIGLTDGQYSNHTVDFTRSDIVKISIKALSVKIKNSEKTLADKLIDDGAISRRDFVEIIEGGVYEEEAPGWSGEAIPFEGRGTKTKPYLIESAENLAQLAINVAYGNTYSGKFFLMTADIDLGMCEWTPIGNYANTFNGIFDGNGHTVHNMYISEAPEGSYVGNWNKWHDYMAMVGLFGMLDGGEIRNLTVNGTIDLAIDSTTDRYCIGVGGIVGMTSRKVTNCTNNCDISVVSESKGGYVSAGGIAGYYYGENCVIKTCTNNGTISGYGLDCVRIGGIGGNNAEGGQVRGCINHGTVSADGKQSSAEISAGGITAKTYNCTVSGCKNYANIYGKDIAGGIIGYQNGDADSNLALTENCVSAGKITGTKSDSIVGVVYAGVVRNCY